MNLKHTPSNELINATKPATIYASITIIATKKSIWERLPYNIGMELHSASKEVATAAAAAMLLDTRNYQHINNKCCQEQLQHQQQQLLNFEHNPPHTTTKTTTMNKDFQSQTLSCAATLLLSASSSSSSSSMPTSGKSLQQHAATTNNTDILQHQQLQLNNNNTFPVDTSDNALRATNVVMQLIQQQQQSSYKNIATANKTYTTTSKRQLDSSCCHSNSNNITGDIPLADAAAAATTSGSSSSSINSSSDSNIFFKLPRRTLQQLIHQLQQQRHVVFNTAMARIVLLLLLTTVTQCWAGRQDALSNCTFPARWEGSWFLSGYQQSIHIKGSQFSYRGKCAASDGNKYLIVDEKGCHRCLVIYEKHKNVLQYKESECEGDSMYLHQTNPSAMAMRSVLKQSGDHSRGGAHPNSNGHSRLSSSDQYIMRSNDDMNDCPSDFCKGRETLQNLCDQIPGDALLYSLFRESAEPVKCPLKGPFVFTYNRGHGECKSPVSNIDSCTEDSRLLLSFQACPDVQGTESTVEELTCLATWKDGNSRYLVGLVSHHHAISNEERYRCFVYEKISSLMGGTGITSSKDAEYKLAQSGDATCNGLDSAEVGSRIMSLRKPPPAERCDFPAWFKGPRHWHALMGNAVYNYHSNDGSMHIIKPNGYMETRALCEQINKQTSTEMMAVVHYTTGCQSGFMCMMFYRRDTHVIEIQTGKQASRLEDACAPDHFDINRMPYITLLANNPDPQICPLEGLYNLRGAIGPPHISARHKRNHNNKGHAGHGHHHLQHDLNAGGGVGIGGNAFGHKRHNTLSFRNSEEIEQSSWHSHTRGLPIRNRRAAGTATEAATFVADDEPANDSTIESDLMRRTAGKKYTATHLNDDHDGADGADDGDDGNTALNNHNKNSNRRVASEMKAFEAAAAAARIVGNHLSKLTVSSASNINNNNNDNNGNNDNIIAINASNKHKNNKKWQQQQKQLKAAATQQKIANAEKIATKSKSSFTATAEKNKQQQQHRLSAVAAAAAGATSASAAASTTDLEVVSGIINATTVDASAPLAVAAAHDSRVAFIATASVTGAAAQQRSRRDAPGCIVNYKAQRQLWIGCTAPNLIDVRPQCNDDGDEEYSCHGSWSENGTVYIIARHKGSKHGVCISYRPLEGTAAQLVIGDACFRGAALPTEHPLVANLTVFGKCGDTSAARPSLHSNAPEHWWTTLAATSAALLLTCILNHTHTRSLAHTSSTR